MNQPEIVEMLVRRDAKITELQEEVRQLREALQKAKEHLEYCNYGDSWERECAYNDKLPEKIEKALNN